MQKKIKLTFNTVFTRILFFNLIVIIISTIIPQIIFYNYFTVTYNNEIKGYNMKNVARIASSIDELILERAISISNYFLPELQSNSDFTYPLYNDISNDYLRITAVKQKLSDIRATLKYIDSIDLYYLDNNILFTGSSVHYLNDPASDKLINREWFNRIYNAGSGIIWIPARKISFGEPYNVSAYIRNIPFYASKDNRQAILAVNIKEQALFDLICNTDSYGYNGKTFIINKNGIVVSHSDREKVADNIENDKNIRRLLSMGGEGMFDTVVDGKKSVLSFVSSKYNDWIYVSVVSIDTLYQKSNQMKNFLVVICMLLLGLNIITVVAMTKKAHKPIRVIINTVKGISKRFGNNDSGKNESEFKLVDNVLNNLVFRISELNQRLEDYKPTIYHNTVVKILYGKIKILEGTANEELFGLSFDKEKFFCFILKIQKDENINFENRMLINYNIIEKLKGIGDSFNINAVTDDNNTVSGIVNFPSSIDFKNVIREIVSEIERLLNIKYVLCVGDSYSIDQEEISKSYYEACECMKYTFVRTSEKLLIYGQLMNEALKETDSVSKMLEKIEDYIRSGDEARLKSAIDEIIESIIAGGFNVESCKNTLMEVVSVFRRTIISMGYDENDLFEYDIREYFKSIENIDEYRLWIHLIVETGIAKTSERKNYTSKGLEEKVRKFIKENIYNDLNLTSVSEGVHISSSYLSKIFKVVTGRNFSDYVTDAKLDHAVELLKECKLSVKDISAKLGYNTPHHFIKIFKEKYGYTPKEYQRKITVGE